MHFRIAIFSRRPERNLSTKGCLRRQSSFCTMEITVNLFWWISIWESFVTMLTAVVTMTPMDDSYSVYQIRKWNFRNKSFDYFLKFVIKTLSYAGPGLDPYSDWYRKKKKCFSIRGDLSLASRLSSGFLPSKPPNIIHQPPRGCFNL